VVRFEDQGVVGKGALNAAPGSRGGSPASPSGTWAARPTPGRSTASRSTAEVISSLILEKIKRDAEAKLGEFRKVVITVPAFFNEPRRKATQDAGQLAGLEVLDISNEPAATAIARIVVDGGRGGHRVHDRAGRSSSKELNPVPPRRPAEFGSGPRA
jgi:hypothetical protein